MLENDLILARFLEARGAAMSEAEVAALDRLLDLSDNELWDLLSGRSEPDDPPCAAGACCGPLTAPDASRARGSGRRHAGPRNAASRRDRGPMPRRQPRRAWSTE